MSKRDGGPAFPMPFSTDEHTAPCNSTMADSGMTLRDYFAAATLANPNFHDPDDTQEEIARCAYSIADCMLQEREKCI